MTGAHHAEPCRNDQSCVSHASAPIDGDLCLPGDSGMSVGAWPRNGYCGANKWAETYETSVSSCPFPLRSGLRGPRCQQVLMLLGHLKSIVISKCRVCRTRIWTSFARDNVQGLFSSSYSLCLVCFAQRGAALSICWEGTRTSL